MTTSARSDDCERIASLLQTIADDSCRTTFTGIAIGVIAHGQEFSAVSGWADVASKRPISDSTVFEIGAVPSSLADMLKFLRANVYPEKSGVADELAAMRQSSKLPERIRRQQWLWIGAIAEVAGLAIYKTFMSGAHWLTQIEPDGLLHLSIMLLPTLGVTIRWGRIAGAVTLLLMTVLTWCLWGPTLAWFPELIWGAIGIWQFSRQDRLPKNWSKPLGGDGQLAWQSSVVGRHPILWHSGLARGSARYLGIAPEMELGVVVLTNTANSVDAIGVQILSEMVKLNENEHPEQKPGASLVPCKSRRWSSIGAWLMKPRVAASLILAFTLLLAFASPLFTPNYAGAPRSDGPSGAWLASEITGLRKENELVGLAAMVMVDGKVVATAADGERKRGSGVPIELGDRWHLGSVTKSITATMIARLVESGRMQWSETVGERFPDASMHKDWKPVTLRQLLTHTSGAPDSFSFWVMRKRPALGAECTQERRKAVMDVIAEKPASPPGTKYAYSNVGFTIAAAMAEAATGESWEDRVKREVFAPLELSGAGFGPPQSPSRTLEQPRGHHGIDDWKVSASDKEDNTPIMGPAGSVHMTLRDLCTYATEHLRGEQGTGKLLAAKTYKRLHTPELDNYACGWVKKGPTREIPHTVYWHNGSNKMWYALVVFIPDKNMTVAVTANDGDMDQAEPAAWKIVNACANQFNVEGDAARPKSQQPEN